MDHFHGVADWGAGAFWLFLGAAVIAGAWEKNRKNAEKHETLRRIIEKTGNVDEAKLKEVFSPSGPDWMTSKPGEGYRGLRVGGIVVMGLGAAIAFAFLALGLSGVGPGKAMKIGLAIAGAVAVFGFGLFYSSRFAEPPPDQRNGPSAR
jgi:hypothetical protein